MIADGGGGAQTHRRTDFPDEGGIAVFLHKGIYIFQNSLGFITGSSHEIIPPSGVFMPIIAHMNEKEKG